MAGECPHGEVGCAICAKEEVASPKENFNSLAAWLPKTDGASSDLFWGLDRNSISSRPKSRYPKLSRMIFRLGDWVERQGRKIVNWSNNA